MKIGIITMIFLLSNVCYADISFIPVNNYKKCRQDFAVKLCKQMPETYGCYKFHKKGKQYISWEEAFEKFGDRVKVLVQKINRRNNTIWLNHCIAIPKDLNKAELDYAPFPLTNNKYKEKTIIVDLGQLAFGAYENGKLIIWGPANGGVGKCKETGKYTCKTPVGEWKVYEIKKGFRRSSLYPIECKNKKICGHPYYNVVKFGPHFEALHGENNGHVPGVNISHGCTRIFKEDSKFLANSFAEIGTKVIVLPY